MSRRHNSYGTLRGALTLRANLGRVLEVGRSRTRQNRRQRLRRANETNFKVKNKMEKGVNLKGSIHYQYRTGVVLIAPSRG